MSGNKKRNLTVVSPQDTVAARLIITAYTDRPPNVECTGPLEVALKLAAAGLQILGNMVGNQASKVNNPVEDKKREFLGPREG